jgi:enoyl-CoA hydratase
MSGVARRERDGILLITLDRPAARNAIDADLSRGYAAALAELDARDDLRAGVVTGAASTFCSGMDLKAFAGRPAEEAEQALARVVRPAARTPLIAAVEGFAVGGGFELALACDLIVAAGDTSFGLPEVRHGLVPAGGGLLRLPDRVAFGVALELALTGDLVGAERLHGLGLVNRLTPPGGALEGALALARRIAANGPLAVRSSRALLWDDAGDRWARQDRVARAVNASDDAREGIAAFAEKRPPAWSRR